MSVESAGEGRDGFKNEEEDAVDGMDAESHLGRPWSWSGHDEGELMRSRKVNCVSDMLLRGDNEQALKNFSMDP